MTGDLGPGQMPEEDLAAVFDPYLVAAAGLAAERQDDECAALLNDRGRVDVDFAEFPITVADEEPRASVEVVLRPGADLAGQVPVATRRRIAELLNEIAGADGYHVAEVRVATEELGGGCGG